MSREALLERLFRRFEGWCVTWGLSRLAREAHIEFADDLGLALGTCELRAGRIRLNAVLLLPDNEALLFETLCHEAAHLVAYLRYGPGIAEHGVEWQDYMERAGYRPRAVLPAARVAGLEGTGTVAGKALSGAASGPGGRGRRRSSAGKGSQRGSAREGEGGGTGREEADGLEGGFSA